MSLCTTCQLALPDFSSISQMVVLKDNPSFITKELSVPWTWKKGRSTTEQSEYFRSTRGRRRMHSSWESLVASLDVNCPICWKMWREIRSSPIALPRDEPIEDFRAEIASVRYNTNDGEYNMTVLVNCTGRHLSRFLFGIWKTTQKTFEQTESEAPIATTHTPQSAANVANQWLQVCDADHPLCMERASAPPSAKMPLRLLELGSSDSTTWQIVETCQVRVPYVTLSHRWSENTPSLLEDNYQDYCTPQPDSILPQRYIDVVSICRAIPIRHIWIDSLCIVQNDDGSDFRHEAPLMMDFYRYSFLTLMICWNVSNSTVFRNCSPRSISRPKPVSYCQPAYERDSEEVAIPQKTYAFVEPRNITEYRTDIINAPINKRAWVVQERCLSKRILCLGNDQLWWECGGGPVGSFVANETCPQSGFSWRDRETLQTLSSKDSTLSWSLILERYTRCQLTYEQDRFIGISGLAKTFANLTGRTYFAGIWLETWMHGLLWESDEARHRVDRKKSVLAKPQTMTAPSWSWLSYSGSVLIGTPDWSSDQALNLSTKSPSSFKSDYYQPLAFLVQSTLTPLDTDPFTSFERALLRIRCLLIPVEFSESTDIEKLADFCWQDYNPEHSTTFDSAGLDFMRLQSCEALSNRVHFRVRFSRVPDHSSSLFLLPLYLQKGNYFPELGEDPEEMQAGGLVLQDSYNNGDREFIRVGMWKESLSYAPQLGPMIINTIVAQGIGKTSSVENITEDERIFGSKLYTYAFYHSSLEVNFSMQYEGGDEVT
ncbi:hypothetical protein LB503_004835, partial [Fusarium chuoi]